MDGTKKLKKTLTNVDLSWQLSTLPCLK